MDEVGEPLYSLYQAWDSPHYNPSTVRPELITLNLDILTSLSIVNDFVFRDYDFQTSMAILVRDSKKGTR